MHWKKIIYILILISVFSCNKKEDTNDDKSIDWTGLNVNPEYSPIDWSKTSVLECNTTTGNFSFQFQEPLPKIEKGTVLTVDLDTAGYIRIVKDVKWQGNKATIQTAEGRLTDIFANTSFTLSTSTAIGQARNNTTSGNVFYPSHIIYTDKHGNKVKKAFSQTRADEFRFTHDIWNWKHDLSNTILFKNEYSKIYLQDAYFNIDIDLVMSFNFGALNNKDFVENALNKYTSKAMSVTAYIQGIAETKQTLRLDALGEFEYKEKEDELWKHNLFTPLQIKFLTPTGIPIFVDLRSDMFRGASFNLSGEFSAYAGFEDKVTGEIGFTWQQSTGEIKEHKKISNKFTLLPPTIEGIAEAEAKVWIYPRIKVYLYGAVGPSFDLKPYLSTTISGGFKEELLSSSNDYCAWTLSCNTGLDFGGGLSFAFLGYEIDNIQLASINLIDAPLYESPRNILLSSDNQRSLVIGQTTTVSFDVVDFNYILNTQVPTHLHHIVKFDGGGTVHSKYGIVKNGKVSVKWTPLKTGDALTAKLVDKNGAIISSAELTTTAKRVKTIKTTSLDGLSSSYTLQYAYDNQGRVETIQANNDLGLNTIAINYEDNLIAYTKTGSSVENYQAMLDNDGRVTRINITDGDDPSWTENLTYTNNFLMLAQENEKYETTLIWNDENMTSSTWSRLNPENSYETSTIEYDDNNASMINLDINWLLYPEEGLAFVAGSGANFSLLTSQGYCGIKNKNFMTKCTVNSHKITNTGTDYLTSTEVFLFKYQLDRQGCPTKITKSRQSSLNDKIRESELIEIIYY